MKFRITVKKQAEKFLDKLPKQYQEKIIRAIYNLPNGSVKKMQGFSERYRLRVGDFRIIYDKYDENLLICVIAIGNRGDIYKSMF